MITPSQSPKSTSIAHGKGSAPYAGPERRVADRRRAYDAASRTGGYHELGPYVPVRGRSAQRTPVVHVPAFLSAVLVESPVTDTVTFEVLDEEFIMAEAILAEREPHAEVADAEIAVAPPRAGIELPWITAFLDDVPEAVAASEWLDATLAHDVDVSIAEQVAIEAELWPLDDAGSRLRELAKALTLHTEADGDSFEHVAALDADVPAHGGAPVAPLAMWSDDDFVDVMPVHVTSLPPGVVAPPAITPRPAPTRDTGDAHESAALALEALAGRVRRGEVELPAFDAELNDAAALATALVVLLGTRP